MKACKHLNSSFSNLATSSSAPPYCLEEQVYIDVRQWQQNYSVRTATQLFYITGQSVVSSVKPRTKILMSPICMVHQYVGIFMVKISNSNLLGWFGFRGAKYTLGDILVEWVRLFKTLLLYRRNISYIKVLVYIIWCLFMPATLLSLPTILLLNGEEWFSCRQTWWEWLGKEL